MVLIQHRGATESTTKTYPHRVTRSGPIDVAALHRRREAFLGRVQDREARAKSIVVPGRSAGSADIEDAVELLRRVPLPFLARLVDEGFTIKIDRDPGEKVLREIARAVDRSLGRGDVTWSAATAAFGEALEKDRARVEGSADGAFVEVFGRWIGREGGVAQELPALHAALQDMLDGEMVVEEARAHPERIKRVMGFLRTHVLKNPRLSEAAKGAISRRAQRDSGPWDQADVDRHAKGVREAAGKFVVETRWGAEPYPLTGAPDAAEDNARVALFLDKLVRPSTRISAKGKERLERGAARAYGPWRADDFEKFVTSVFESRGRYVVQTKAGNVTIEV